MKISNEAPRKKSLKKVVGLGLLGLVSWGGFMVAGLPAALVYQYAPIPDSVSMAGLSGSLWKGRAESVVVDGIRLPGVEWQITPWSLAAKTVVADVSLGTLQDPLSARGLIEVSQSGVRMENLSAEASVPWVMQHFGGYPADLVEVTGVVGLEVDSAEFSLRGCTVLAGDLALERSSVYTPYGELPLGKANVKLNCEDGSLVADVRQSSPALSSEGRFTLNAGRRYQFIAELDPGEAMPEKLEKGLPLVARAEPDGGYSIRFSGRL